MNRLNSLLNRSSAELISPLGFKMQRLRMHNGPNQRRRRSVRVVQSPCVRLYAGIRFTGSGLHCPKPCIRKWFGIKLRDVNHLRELKAHKAKTLIYRKQSVILKLSPEDPDNSVLYAYLAQTCVIDNPYEGFHRAEVTLNRARVKTDFILFIFCDLHLHFCFI